MIAAVVLTTVIISGAIPAHSFYCHPVADGEVLRHARAFMSASNSSARMELPAFIRRLTTASMFALARPSASIR
jgi:hypothetical protein